VLRDNGSGAQKRGTELCKERATTTSKAPMLPASEK
jgi:hypothetical protein